MINDWLKNKEVSIICPNNIGKRLRHCGYFYLASIIFFFFLWWQLDSWERGKATIGGIEEERFDDFSEGERAVKYGWVPWLVTWSYHNIADRLCTYVCMISCSVVSDSVFSCFSRVWLCATLWTVVCQAPLSMGFSRQEYWSGQPFPSPEDLLFSGIEPRSLA